MSHVFFNISANRVWSESWLSIVLNVVEVDIRLGIYQGLDNVSTWEIFGVFLYWMGIRVETLVGLHSVE